MQISNNSYNNRINFAGHGAATKSTQNIAKKSFNWFAKQCDVSSTGELSRGMFVTVAAVFMLGGRFASSRSNDERREVLVRDVPGVFTAVYGAPLLNSALAYASTKKSGIPIMTLNPKKKNILGTKFVSQKQVIDWYSDLGNLKNPLNTFAETINKHGGNIRKVFDKLKLSEMLNNVVTNKEASNEEILDTFKKSQDSDAFKKLETSIIEAGKNKNNAVLKIAKRNQALVKLGGLGFTAALLGVFLPRLNIVTTQKKYSTQQPSSNNIQKQQVRNQNKLSQKQKEVFGSFIK